MIPRMSMRIGIVNDLALAREVLRRVVALVPGYVVAWTAEDGLEQGFETIVIEDATRAIDTNGSLEAARTRMDATGVGRISIADLL